MVSSLMVILIKLAWFSEASGFKQMERGTVEGCEVPMGRVPTPQPLPGHPARLVSDLWPKKSLSLCVKSLLFGAI